ncbi:hypothetical protein MRB53_041732 [Persea americana]|nr:hypothetical protein MRB53_041732 [Persea americana]
MAIGNDRLAKRRKPVRARDSRLIDCESAEAENTEVGMSSMPVERHRYSLFVRSSRLALPVRPTSCSLSPALQSSGSTAFSRAMAASAGAKRKHKHRGAAVAKIVAENTNAHPDLFERDVQMWVFEENIKIPKESKHYKTGSPDADKPQKLTSVINELHENVKYLPDISLPHNLIANPSLEDSVNGSSILVFNLPHQFITQTCQQLSGHILPYARGISCIKGVDVSDKGISLFSDVIGEKLGIYCGALSGANIANEVAMEKFGETTVAYDPPKVDLQSSSTADSQREQGTEVQGLTKRIKLHPIPADYPVLDQRAVKQLFHRPYFHVRLVSDVAGVSLGGALKNIVALAAGFVDGLGWGDNAKAAVMRVGLVEQVQFGMTFFPDSFKPTTLTEESCGVADMITSCSNGRNFRCAKMSVERGVSINQVEKTELNGQKLQGTLTAYEVNAFLRSKGMEADFPLLTAVYSEYFL